MAPAGESKIELIRRRESLATSVEAPMVGKILRIEKQAGDHVDEDEVVIVMEAMKMEIPIVAPVAGTLKEIMVSPGQAVEAEQALAVIE
jgi:biotin carboxyl carrier protein